MSKAKVEQPSLLPEGEIADAPDPVAMRARDVYNEIAGRVNIAMGTLTWHTANSLTAARRKRIKGAIKDYGGVHKFREHLESVMTNDFMVGLSGRTGDHKNWKPDFSWFLQDKTITKILDGGYPAGQPRRVYIPKAGLSTPQQATEAPFKHDIESPADRMAFTISRYRAAGKWADANRVEESLAALQKRPPVLVPSPDTAHLTGSAFHAAAVVPEKSPADREADRRRAFEAKNRANATELPGWLDEAIPDSAYGED